MTANADKRFLNVNPHYARQGAPDPPGPQPESDQSWWATIIDGEAMGEATPYWTGSFLGDGGCRAWYVDEVDPVTGQSCYPSHTRDANNNWAGTYVFNRLEAATSAGLSWKEYNSWWPVPFGWILQVSQQRRGSTDYWRTWAAPIASQTKVLSVYAGEILTLRFTKPAMGTPVLSAPFGPSDPLVAESGSIPLAKLNDSVICIPWMDGWYLRWKDSTPRIKIAYGGTYAGSDKYVRLDPALNSGRGALYADM